MSGFEDLQRLRRVIIQTITSIGQWSEFIAFLQVEATSFNFRNHLQRTALQHELVIEFFRTFFTHHSIYIFLS